MGGRLSNYLQKFHNVHVGTRRQVTPEILAALGQVVSYIDHDSLLLERAFPDSIDVLIHLAALNDRECIRNPSLAMEVNVNQTRRVIDNAIKKKVKRIVYFSTVHVYGKMQGDITEGTCPDPHSTYAITHKLAEDHLISACTSDRVEGIVLRMSNAFGSPVLKETNCWHLIVNDACMQATGQGFILLNSNGCQRRDFVPLLHVERIARFFTEVELLGRECIYNATSGNTMTVLEMVNLVAGVYSEEFGPRIPIKLPEGCIHIDEPPVRIIPDGLKGLGLEIGSNYLDELKGLINYCRSNLNVNG